MNKSGFALASVLSLSALPALAAPTTWDIDAMHSAASFSVKHMMVSTVRGSFNAIKGTVTLDGTDWKTAAVDATIDVASIDTREPKRDSHLKSPDFLDVAKYPTMTFKSTKLDVVAGGALKLTGNLTIHGVTKPVTFDVTPVSKEYKNPYGQTVIGSSATTKISRKDFGLVWNKPLDQAGGMMVGDEVTLTIDVELDKHMAAAPAAAGAKPAAPAKK